MKKKKKKRLATSVLVSRLQKKHTTHKPSEGVGSEGNCSTRGEDMAEFGGERGKCCSEARVYVFPESFLTVTRDSVSDELCLIFSGELVILCDLL